MRLRQLVYYQNGLKEILKMLKNTFHITMVKEQNSFMNTISDKDSLYRVMRSTTDLGKLSEMASAIDKDPELINRFNQAEEFSNLLKEYNVTSISELRAVLESASTSVPFPKAEITQEDLASLGSYFC